MSDLGLTFSPGAARRAGTAFVDRVEECQAFDRAFELHGRAVASGLTDPVDMEVPRSNVLSFYGYPGIGKTTLSDLLSRRLQGEDLSGRVDWPPFARGAFVPIAASWSLTDEREDLARFLLALRASLVPEGIRCDAFDLGFYRYWHEQRPEEDLDAFLRAHASRLSSNGRRELGQLLRGSIDDILGVANVPTATVTNFGRMLAARLGAHGQRTRVGQCPHLGDLLAHPADGAYLAHLPYLLAWDLEQARRTRPGLRLVVFIDHFEVAQSAPDIELRYRRAAYLMPNVLFVITGRRQLRWALREGELTGAATWPLLADGVVTEPRQHLVGQLDDADARRYVERVEGADGGPVIPSDVRDLVVAAARGWPLFLDTVITYYLSAGDGGQSAKAFLEELANDGAATAHDAMPQLVDKLLIGLPDTMRRLVRAASLLSSFTPDLLHQTAGIADHGPVDDFVETPFVRQDSMGLWPFQLHEEIANVVRLSDRPRGMGWSVKDWTLAAERAIEMLRGEVEIALEAGSPGRAIEVFVHMMTLACRARVGVRQVVPTAIRIHDLGIWAEAFLRLEPSGQPIATSTEAVAAFFAAMAERGRKGNRASLASLDEIPANLLPHPFDQSALNWRGLLLRQLGRRSEAIDVLQQAAAAPGKVGLRALHNLAASHSGAGDYASAMSLLDDEDERIRGLRGDMWFRHAQFDRALADLAHARANAAAEGHLGHVVLWDAVTAYVAGFRGQPGDDVLVRPVLEHVAPTRMTLWAYGGCGLALTGLVDEPYAHLADIRADAVRLDAQEFAVVATVAEVLLRLRDELPLEPAWGMLESEFGPTNWDPVAEWITGRKLRRPSMTVSWALPTPVVASAWREVGNRWRDRIAL